MVTCTPPPLSDVQPTMLPLSSSADEFLSMRRPPPLPPSGEFAFHWLPVIIPPRTSFPEVALGSHVHRPLFSSTVK